MRVVFEVSRKRVQLTININFLAFLFICRLLFFFVDAAVKLNYITSEILDYTYVEVPNSNNRSCSNSSLLECSPTTWIRFPAETCLSRVALVKDGDDLGQVSSVQ
jgi:hypothetical protein